MSGLLWITVLLCFWTRTGNMKIDNIQLNKCSRAAITTRPACSTDRIAYTREQKKEINMKSSQRVKFKSLPFQSITRILELKLTKRNIAKKKKNTTGYKRQLNEHNLIRIQLGSKIETDKSNSVIRVATVNCRSVKTKEELVYDLIEENKLEILVLTETWLQDHDDIWVKTSSLNLNGLTLHQQNRKH